MMKRSWIGGVVVGAAILLGVPFTPVTAATGAGPGTESNHIAAAEIGQGFEASGSSNQALGDTTAQIRLDAGPLTLDAVPNFNFGGTSLKALGLGPVVLNLVDGTVARTAGTFDGNALRQIIVSDYRGTGAGWTLSAAVGDFTHDDGASGKAISGAEITLGSVSADVDGPAAPVQYQNSFGQAGAEIFSAQAGGNPGRNTLTVNTAELALPQTGGLLNGRYTTTINWTLGVVPAVGTLVED